MGFQGGGGNVCVVWVDLFVNQNYAMRTQTTQNTDVLTFYEVKQLKSVISSNFDKFVEFHRT